MNYRLEITMSYEGLGGNPTSSVTIVCNKADISNLKFTSENVGGGRRRDEISGNIIVSSNYSDFATYLNDTTGYYVDPDFFDYDIWINGEELNTNVIELIENDIENSRLTFKLSGDCINEYTKVYSNWQTEYNVIAGVAAETLPVKNVSYTDPRSVTSTTTTTATAAVTSQTAYENYINSLIDSEDYKQPYRVTLSAPVFGTRTVTIYWRSFRAYGYYNGTEKEPPAGIDWTYDSDVSIWPYFKKRPKFISVTYVDYNSISSMDQYITIEDEIDIIYGDTGNEVNRTLEKVVEYLFQEADSTIATDGSSFNGFDYPIGAGTFNSSTRFLANAMLIVMSDFIPNLDGTQKEVPATKGFMSLNTIMGFLEQLGMYWYLEESGGTYYLRIQHIKRKSLGSTNPDLRDYYGRNKTYKTRKVSIEGAKYDKVINDTISSWYDFRLPEYVYRTGTKTESIQSSEIITEPNYVIDAKDAVFDADSGKQWVLLATTQNGSTLDYDIRQFTSGLTGRPINNYELSFYWLANNFIEVPGRFDEADTDLGVTRLTKRKQVTIKLTIKNPQTDFDFYDSIEYFDEDAEIQSLELSALKDEGELTLKFK